MVDRYVSSFAKPTAYEAEQDGREFVCAETISLRAEIAALRARLAKIEEAANIIALRAVFKETPNV